MAHKVFIRDGSGWKQLRKININTERNVRKRIRKGWVKTENNGWKLFFGFSFPVGIILPTISPILPSGWEWFTRANGRPIIGKDTKIPFGLGGVSSIIHTTSVPYAGTHGAGVSEFCGTVCSPCDKNRKCIKWDSDSHQGYNRGGHSHSPISASVSVLPKHTEIRFVKLMSDGEIPPGVCIMSTNDMINPGGDNPSTLRLIEESNNSKYRDSNKDHYMACGSGGTKNHFKNYSKVVTTSTEGLHHHSAVWKTLITYDPGGPFDVAVTQGAHNHSARTTAETENYHHLYLSLWRSATKDIELADNIIGMWESDTPPEGWFICDGNNGTPDLRNKFIRYGNSGNRGRSGGSGKVSLGIDTDITGSHNHKANISCAGGDLNLRHAKKEVHNHPTLPVKRTILPRYYALSFIMRKEI